MTTLKKRALLVVSDAAFRCELVTRLTRRGIAADAVDGYAAANALNAVSTYTHCVLEVTPSDPEGPRLLSELSFRPTPPKIVVLAPNEPPAFRKRLQAFGPDRLFDRVFDEPTVSAIVETCVADLELASESDAAIESDTVDTAEVSPTAEAQKTSKLVVTREGTYTPATLGNKSVVAVRVADEERGLEVVSLLEAEGFVVRLTHTTDELYAMLNHDRIDLLIIEDRLPGILNGLDVIEMLQRELLRPDVLLVSQVRQAQAERIKALMPSRIVPPNATPDMIAATACALLKQRKSQVCFVPLSARQIVAEHSDLRPLPQLLVKLTSYLSVEDNQISIRDLAHDIQSDPRATADLLRFTNSASHGLRRRVNNVTDAVTLLGARRTIVLILSQCASATSANLIADWAEPLRSWFFRRNALTAGLAQAYAKIEGVSPDTAFLLGLIQDIGIAVTANAEGERYGRLIERVQSVPQLALANVERGDYGHTHADVSAALLQKWDMPASLIDPVLAHHGSPIALSKVSQGFVHVMQIAEAIADLADCHCPQRSNRLNDLLASYNSRQQSQCSQATAEGIARAVEATELLRLPIPNPESMTLLAEELQAVQEGELVALV